MRGPVTSRMNRLTRRALSSPLTLSSAGTTIKNVGTNVGTKVRMK